MKVVINACFGGFSISEKAARHMVALGSEAAAKEVAEYEETLRAYKHYKKTGKPLPGRSDFEARMFDIDIKYNNKPRFHGYGPDGGYDRADPHLVATVETLGSEADGNCAQLRVVEIPDGTDYEISEYDGNEHIAEKHRTWS